MGALTEALERYGAPLVSNTDQGSWFTGEAWLGVLEGAGVRIGMDGRGRWIDNRFIERLWRSLKYEAVYLEELVGGHHARRVSASWLDHYNHARPHMALAGRTPAEVYFVARREAGRVAARTAAASRDQLDGANRNEGRCGIKTRAMTNTKAILSFALKLSKRNRPLQSNSPDHFFY